MRKRFSDNLSPAVKYWIFLAGIMTVIFAVMFGSFAASYLNITRRRTAAFETLFDKLIPFPFIGSIIWSLLSAPWSVCFSATTSYRSYAWPNKPA